MNKLTHQHRRFFSIVVAFVLASPPLAQTEPQQVTSLTFQADIYGSLSLETVEYVGELRFRFGSAAPIYWAELIQGTDGMGYAVTTNYPNAFTLNVSPMNSGTPVTLTVTTAEYTTGTVTMPSPSELHAVWEIQESGFHLKLHRRAAPVS